MIVKLRSDNSGKRKVPLFFSLGTRHCFRRFFCHLSAPRRRSWMVLARENLILKWMMVWGSPYLWKPPITAKKNKKTTIHTMNGHHNHMNWRSLRKILRPFSLMSPFPLSLWSVCRCLSHRQPCPALTWKRHLSLDWFKGTSTGNNGFFPCFFHGFSHEIWEGVPVNVPSNPF